jgi:hypothetical protein
VNTTIAVKTKKLKDNPSRSRLFKTSRFSKTIEFNSSICDSRPPFFQVDSEGVCVISSWGCDMRSVII